MARRFVVLAGGSLLTALAACSYSTALVLVNASAHGLEVRYELEAPLTDGGEFQPMVASLDEYDGTGTDWRSPGPIEALRLADDGRSVTLVLPARSVLRLASDGFRDTPSGDVLVGIGVLELRTATGSRRYEGSEVGRGFHRASRFLWELEYP